MDWRVAPLAFQGQGTELVEPQLEWFWNILVLKLVGRQVPPSSSRAICSASSAKPSSREAPVRIHSPRVRADCQMEACGLNAREGHPAGPGVSLPPHWSSGANYGATQHLPTGPGKNARRRWRRIFLGQSVAQWAHSARPTARTKDPSEEGLGETMVACCAISAYIHARPRTGTVLVARVKR